MDKNEIDLVIEEGDGLYPIEIKTTADPKKSMINAFKCLEKIPDKKVASGALICPAKERLPLTEKDWILPVHLI